MGGSLYRLYIVPFLSLRRAALIAGVAVVTCVTLTGFVVPASGAAISPGPPGVPFPFIITPPVGVAAPSAGAAAAAAGRGLLGAGDDDW